MRREDELRQGSAAGAVAQARLSRPADGQRLDHAQSQSGAGRPGEAGLAPVEALEQPVALLLGDPWTLIGHSDSNPVTLRAPADRDLGPGRRVVERVLDQV